MKSKDDDTLGFVSVHNPTCCTLPRTHKRPGSCQRELQSRDDFPRCTSWGNDSWKNACSPGAAAEHANEEKRNREGNEVGGRPPALSSRTHKTLTLSRSVARVPRMHKKPLTVR